MAYSPEQYEEAGRQWESVREEIGRLIVGQEEAVRFTLYSILAGGHALLEGLPGLGKTMLIRAIAEVLDLRFSRIQFTPDLMPTDITGTNIIERAEGGRQSFRFQPGPLFSEMVLADEINRATPKTQSALLEAMGERTVTALGETRALPSPFFVLATQNPIEMEGTYPLPEAQVDRFLCKLSVRYPDRSELKEIARRTTSGEAIALRKQLGADAIRLHQQMASEVLIADELLDYAVDLAVSTAPGETPFESIREFVQYGSGPRGVQSIVRLAKARALCAGRFHVSIADIRTVAAPALRHRLLLNYEAAVQGVEIDGLLQQVLAGVQQGRSL